MFLTHNSKIRIRILSLSLNDLMYRAFAKLQFEGLYQFRTFKYNEYSYIPVYGMPEEISSAKIYFVLQSVSYSLTLALFT